MFVQQKEEVERAKEKIFQKLKKKQEERDIEPEELLQLYDELNRELLEKLTKITDIV